MSSRLLSDLEAWESGQLELSVVEARNPGADVTGLVQLHEVMSDAGTNPMPASAASWECLKNALPARGAPPHPNRRKSPHGWIQRPVLVATATMLLGGSALAMTSEPVREGVKSAWRKVASLVNLDAGESSDSGPTPGETSDARGPGATGSGAGAAGRGQGPGNDPGPAPGRSGEAKGRGRGPKKELPEVGGGPNSVPGAAGKGDGSPTGTTPPGAGGEDGALGKSDGSGQAEGTGKSGDAGKPEGTGTAKAKDEKDSGEESTPDDTGTGNVKGAGKPDNPGKPDDPGGGNGNSGGNGNDDGNGTPAGTETMSETKAANASAGRDSLGQSTSKLPPARQ